MRCGTLLAAGLALGFLGCKSERASPLVEVAKQSLHDGELSPAIPIFNVRSLADSQRYYRDKLGFKIEWEDGDPPSFGAVSRGHGVLFLCEGCQGDGRAWVMMFAEDVDKLYRDMRDRHAFIKMPPTTMPWKLREMHVADLEGNVMRFASRTDH
jgi:catechol 2,3-dioxygenase-like lactoylglutathione lyase family enzyme